MYYEYIDISISKQKMTVPNQLLKWVCGTKGIIICRFTFDNSGSDFNDKTAFFKNSNGTNSERINISNNTCEVPESILENVGIISIGVEGNNSTQRQKTQPKAIIKQTESI